MILKVKVFNATLDSLLFSSEIFMTILVLGIGLAPYCVFISHENGNLLCIFIHFCLRPVFSNLITEPLGNAEWL